MFTKQVSRPLDSLDARSWPPRRSRSSELEEKPAHGPDPRFLCPTRSIPVAKFRTVDSPSEDLHLVAEDGVLQLELRDVPTSGEHSHEANEHQIDEGSQGASMLPTGVDQGGTEFWSPAGSSALPEVAH